jgi:L-threonylcarbamoyladenylate synthase
MKTLYLKVNPKRPEVEKIRAAARILQRGGLVAFPTETVYGLGANALSAKAVKKIFRTKGRPADNPLIVHLASKTEIFKYAAYVPKIAETLIRRFWPGPLTIILKKKDIFPKDISSGLSTVALRLPKNKIAQALIREAGFPLAAPSANTSGRPSPTHAKHVMADLKNRIECVLDGGETHVGLESTVIDLSERTPVILRPGKITLERLKKIIPAVTQYGPKHGAAARSPGMKYRHYAPKAELFLVEGDRIKIQKKIQTLADTFKNRKKSVVILTGTRNTQYRHPNVHCIGRTMTAVAKNLFMILRDLDKQKADVILVEGMTEKNLGRAVMNRLRKAAGHNVIKV